MFYYDNTDLNEIFFRKFFSVNVADNSFDVVKEDIYEYEDIADKSTFLYNYELIGEKEHVENIAEYFLLTNDDVLWIHESFASAIGCIYEDDYAYLKAGQVRTFLSKSWLSLKIIRLIKIVHMDRCYFRCILII